MSPPVAPKNLADLLSLPVNILTCDEMLMRDVTVIDWNNNYGLVCQTVQDGIPYWCYVPMNNISHISRKTT